MAALVTDRGGWGDWWLTDPGLAPTRTTQAQADLLLAGVEGVEVLCAGACEVRFGEMLGDLLLEMADGRWLTVSQDGVIDDVTREVVG